MVKARKITNLLTCLFLSPLNIASSQEFAALPLSEADFFTDFPVVLTATRLKQPQKNSPVATTIIDRKMIEASGFTEIADLLRLAPGMLVNYDGNVPAVGYGFLYHRYTVRLQVLVDGRSVYTPIFGEMPWTQLGLTIDDIERIEVIRGPSSSSYGPNAMTGVISIITRHASLDKGAKVKINIGKNGLREQFIRIGESSNNLDYKISVARRLNDGFKDRDDDLNISLVNFRGDYQLTNRDNLIFHLTYNDGTFDEEDGLLHQRETLNTEQHVKWSHTFDNKNDFTLQYYQQKRVDYNNYTDATTVAPFSLFINNNVTSSRKNLEFSHSLHGDNYSFSWGGILREDSTMAPQYLYQATVNTVDTKQIFANAEYNIDKRNIINVGVLFDDNDTAESTTSPRISYNHHIDENQTIRFSYAEATRSPFIFEEYTNWVIPDVIPICTALPLLCLANDISPSLVTDVTDLAEEKITSHEIGYIALLNNKKTELDLRYYEYAMSDLIYLDASSTYFDNSDKFSASGFEASITQKYENSRIRFNYAHTNIVGETMISFDQYETGAPKDIFSFIAMHNFSDTFTGSLGFYYTGSYKQLNRTEQQDVRRRLDMKLSKRFKFNSSDATLAIVVHNLTDERIETNALNNIDRSGYLSFTMEF